jgi:DNA-binding transcriptional LysR family regulator
MATLRQLKIFLAVAEYKKMSIAANKLFIAQPSVSQTIIELEKEYNITLFERTPKELKITPAGILLLTRAKEILTLHDSLTLSMKNFTLHRPLKIGATLTIGDTIMSNLVTLLNQEYPDIDVSVFVDNTRILEHRMIHNELDIALVEGIIRRDEIKTEPVLRDKLELICGPQHPFAQKPILRIEDLANQQFIMRERGSGTRAIFENIMHSHHVPFVTKWECSSSTAILDAVCHNLGLGILSYRSVKEHALKGAVKICPIENVSMSRYFYLCSSKNHPVSSQMQDFTDLIHGLSTSVIL